MNGLPLHAETATILLCNDNVWTNPKAAIVMQAQHSVNACFSSFLGRIMDTKESIYCTNITLVYKKKSASPWLPPLLLWLIDFVNNCSCHETRIYFLSPVPHNFMSKSSNTHLQIICTFLVIFLQSILASSQPRTFIPSSQGN